MKITNSKSWLQETLFLLPSILSLMLMPLVFDHTSQSLISGGVVLASDDGGHDSGGGHTPGGSSGGHSSGGQSSDSSHGKGAASSKGRGKGNPAADQRGGGRASDPDAERGVGYHGGTSIESKVLRGGSSKGKGGPGGRSGDDKHTDGETDDHTDHDDTSHDDDSDSSGSKGRKPPNAGKPEGVGGEDDHDH